MSAQPTASDGRSRTMCPLLWIKRSSRCRLCRHPSLSTGAPPRTPGARRGSTPIRQAGPLHLRGGRAIASMKPARGTRTPKYLGRGLSRTSDSPRAGAGPVAGTRTRGPEVPAVPCAARDDGTPRWRAWLQSGLQFNAVRRHTRRTDRARWSSLNRSEPLCPELLMRHTVQRESTAAPPYSRQRPRPAAHSASWDDGQTPSGAASSGRRGRRKPMARHRRIKRCMEAAPHLHLHQACGRDSRRTGERCTVGPLEEAADSCGVGPDREGSVHGGCCRAG